jgi:hypothetical protein
MAETGNGSKRAGGTKAKSRKEPTPEPEPQPAADAPKATGPVCTVAFCPICMAVTAAQGAAPDALEHLLAAAREFFLAARAVIDTRGDHLAGTEAEPEPSRRFERIEIS